VPSDLDISRDGRLLSASVSDDKGDQFLRVWRLDQLLAGDVTPLREYGFGQSVPESFVFSLDGRYLYGSSYYTGVSNIFRYGIASGEIEAVSNAESGFFRPVPLPDGRLVVLAYTGEGFVPAIIEARPIKDVSAIRFLGTEVAEKYPEVKSWQVPGPATVDEEKRSRTSSSSTPSRWCRATRTPSRSATASTSRTRCSSRVWRSRRPTPRGPTFPPTNAVTSRSPAVTSSGVPPCR
jgi:hypothetical protein